MKTVKPQRLGLLCRPFEHRGRCWLVVVTTVFIDLSSRTPLPEVEMWKTFSSTAPDGVLDEVMPKSRGEMLLDARAYPPAQSRPASACVVRAKLGRIDKKLGIVGDRYWETLSEPPLPFSEMPVDWEHAFGGEGFAPNPRGKGVDRLKVGGGERHPLPNVEDPMRLIRGPADRPMPAGFGLYDISWPQRSKKAGTYDRRWLDDGYPGLANDADLSIFNVAPDDQQIDGFFSGDEDFLFENLHPTREVINGNLPGLRTRAFITQGADGRKEFREVLQRLDTVRFIPHVERAVLLFRGLVEIGEHDASDVIHVLLACEDFEAPRAENHYREVLERRLDRKRGFLYALDDSELLPASVIELVKTEADVRTPRPHAMGENMRRRVEAELERTREDIRARGLSTDALPMPPPAPVRPSAFDGSALSAQIDQAMAMAERAKQQAEARRMEAEKDLRARCEATGLRYDDVAAERAESGGPPQFSADAELRRLRARCEDDRRKGLPNIELEKRIGDARFAQHLATAERGLREVYRRCAHLQSPAPPRSAEEVRRLRRVVEEAIRSRASLAGADLTGADLARLNMSGLDLRGALLERASFIDADLSRAALDGAVLARADLTGARLTKAVLRATNLGAAMLTRAVFDEADLTGAILAKAIVNETRLRAAVLTGADVLGTQFSKADFTDAYMPQLVFIEATFDGTTFEGADLTKSTFLESNLVGVSFDRAVLASVVFLSCNLEAARFRAGDLQNLRVTGECNLERCDFASANLSGANLRRSRLRDAQFADADLTGADFSEAEIARADLSRVKARGARFTKARANGASLPDGDFMDALFEGASLHGANLRGANLFGADLARVRIDTGTRFEDANLKRARLKPKAQT